MKKNLLFLFVTVIFFGCKNKKYEEEKSEAYDALQFLGTMNAYPDVDIPDAAFGNAYNFYKTNFQNNNLRAASVASWQSIGPNNVGGRTISIAIDPVDTNIIWLGSASGGLWKSVSGGIGVNAWQYIPTGFPVLGVAAITINPQNTSEMYIGTGETYDYGTSVNGLVIRTTRGSNGIGILKSTDGGATWTHALNWLYNQRRTVWDIIVNPQNSNTVYAATTEGVLKSIDAGVTWSTSLNQLMVMDLEMDPSDTSLLYAGVGNLTSLNKGLYKTTNAGSTWNVLAGGLPVNNHSGRISVRVYKNNPNIVMAHIADDFNSVGLYRSTNKGVNWTLVTNDDVASIQGWYSKCLMMKEDDDTHVLVGGVSLFESFSSGSNVNQITYYDPSNIQTMAWPDMHDIVSNPFDADKIYLLTDAGLYRSNDFGITWYWCADGYVVSQFYHGSVSTTDSMLALGGLQDRNTQFYSGSLYWTPYFNGDGTFNAIDPVNDSVQYVSSQYLNIEQSTDRGQTFPNYVFGGTNAAFVAPYLLAPSSNLTMYAGDESVNKIDLLTFFTTTNPVVSAGQKILSIAVSHQNENKIYFTLSPTTTLAAKVYKSLNAGATSTNISTGLPNRYPRDIEVNPSNDNEAIVVFSGFGAGHIFKTTNGGTSWTDISTTLPDIPFHSILFDPNNPSKIYAGSDLGVFYTTNSGATWQTLNSGLPEAVMIFDLQYSPANNSLMAFTHGHGVYKINLTDVFTGHESVLINETSLSIFPNPLIDKLNLAFNAMQDGIVTMEIINEQSQVVYTTKQNFVAGKNKQTLNCVLLKSGIYFLKVGFDNKHDTKSTLVKKFVVM